MSAQKKVVLVRCPDCRRGFCSIIDLYRHAKQTNCDISVFEKMIFDVCSRRVLAIAERRPLSYD